jgi:hypothetical protein
VSWTKKPLPFTLYADAPQLEITARRRKFISISNSIAAGATGYVVASLAMDATDVLQEGDGVLIDFAMAAASGNQAITNPGTTTQGIALYVQDTVTTSEPIADVAGGDSLILLPQNVSLQAATFDLTPARRLWTSRDLNFQIRHAPAALPPANQPIKFAAAGFFTNAGGAANTVQINFSIFYRVVRGLQEG